MKKLIKVGTDVNLVPDKMTVFGTAESNGQYTYIGFLMEAGATVNIADPFVTPPIATQMA